MLHVKVTSIAVFNILLCINIMTGSESRSVPCNLASMAPGLPANQHVCGGSSMHAQRLHFIRSDDVHEPMSFTNHRPVVLRLFSTPR